VFYTLGLTLVLGLGLSVVLDLGLSCVQIFTLRSVNSGLRSAIFSYVVVW